jgi:hypothetical protein
MVDHRGRLLGQRRVRASRVAIGTCVALTGVVAVPDGIQGSLPVVKSAGHRR